MGGCNTTGGMERNIVDEHRATLLTRAKAVLKPRKHRSVSTVALSGGSQPVRLHYLEYECLAQRAAERPPLVATESSSMQADEIDEIIDSWAAGYSQLLQQFTALQEELFADPREPDPLECEQSTQELLAAQDSVALLGPYAAPGYGYGPAFPSQGGSCGPAAALVPFRRLEQRPRPPWGLRAGRIRPRPVAAEHGGALRGGRGRRAGAPDRLLALRRRRRLGAGGVGAAVAGGRGAADRQHLPLCGHLRAARLGAGLQRRGAGGVQRHQRSERVLGTGGGQPRALPDHGPAGADWRMYGTDSGPLQEAVVQARALVDGFPAVEHAWCACWTERYRVRVHLALQLYWEMRLRHHELWLEAHHHRVAMDSVMGSLEDALLDREERMEQGADTESDQSDSGDSESDGSAHSDGDSEQD